MNPEPNQRQLDALEKYLRGELDASHPDLPAEEAALARQLRAASARMQPAPQFVALLNRQLAQPRAASASQRIEFRYLLSSLAGITALVLLAFLLRWLILSVAPQPPVPALPFTQTPPPPAATATPPAPIPTDAAQVYAPLFYESYRLEAAFPVNQGQANLYEQVIPEAATLETAHTLAAKFGLTGGLYLAPETGPNGAPVYMATDGKQRLYIYSPEHYNYFSDWVRMQETKSRAQDEQFAISQAEAYLQAHNLLDFPYQVEPSLKSPDLVSFAPTVDGLPTRYASNLPMFYVQISAEGQVLYISANLPSYKLVGSYPLRTSENAWDKLVGVNTDLGLVSAVGSISSAENGRTWLRNHPLDLPLSLSGRLDKVVSAEGGESFFSIDDYPLSGNLAGLEQLPESTPVMAQGQFVQDGEVQRFQVETWKKTTQIEFLAGSLERSGEQIFLLSADGRRLELPDLPPEVFAAAQGEEFHAAGVADGERFDWSSVRVGPMGGGGSASSSPALAKLNLSGTPAPTATPPVIPTPLVAQAVTGQRLEGASGGLDIVILISQDGQKRMQVTLGLDRPDGAVGSYHLAEGPGLAGIEKYNLQPVRVWGTVSGLDPYNVPLVTVERYEPIYPGLEIQNLLGKERIATIKGKTVLLFTSEAGRIFVARESLKPDFDPANRTVTDSQILVRGLFPPGEDWGGYPVIDIRGEMTFSPDNTMTLEEIQKQIPGFATNDLKEIFQDPILTGAIIEKIELVYLAKDLSGLTELTDPIYMQPAWDFRGHYTDGTPFEIYVQALTDAYLLPEPDQ